MPKAEERLREALERFAATVTRKLRAVTTGDPEEQLRGPLEDFLTKAGEALGTAVLVTGETRLADHLGRPDFAVQVRDLLAGYVELKAPGKGGNPNRFHGHDKKQWERFKALPNVLYTDGNEWSVYRSGERVRAMVVLSGDVATDGKHAVQPANATALVVLLTEFLAWEPSIPSGLSARQLAELLAPLCRLLRDDVADALSNAGSPLVQLAADWRSLLFPEASDERFADAYAQTVTFALLLARSEGAPTLRLEDAIDKLEAKHSLLSRALEVLTDRRARAEIEASVALLQRVIHAVPPGAMTGTREDPWLYFYEDFLQAYDPKLRKDAGAYYTPVEVVRAQVRLIDRLLTDRLGSAHGFADENVVTLDPAVGTGTYLLGVIDHALASVEAREGEGAVPARASLLAKNLYGFENLVGPFAVCELRVTRALAAKGATFPREGPGTYLADTLESPFAQPPQLPLYLQPIADQHERALRVKDAVPVIVCLGNPPYDRHAAADASNRATTGGWVRWGDRGDGKGPIFDDFTKPARRAGQGGDLKNAYNLYVYFWRWALWKVFEHKTATGPGIVSFITASSYLEGNAFVGMREHLRRYCDEVWIIDLGGEGRGTRRSENVFAIQTPVAIAVAVRSGAPDLDQPAAIHFARIEGTREQKLAALGALESFDDLSWQDCPLGWHEPFRPAGAGAFFDWPLLTDLMPWQQSGAQIKRTWPIAPDVETLAARWKALLVSADRAVAFKETRDRKILGEYRDIRTDRKMPSIASLARSTRMPEPSRYGYRSFDRQWILPDNRLADYLRPVLWRSHGDRQIYFSTLLSQALGPGPALTVSAAIPDLDHFRGSYGAKHLVPLYRDSAATALNIAPGLLGALTARLGASATPEDLAAYVYALLAQPAYQVRFATELETRELRVPLTAVKALFDDAVDLGRRLIWLHTYGERFVPAGTTPGDLPKGAARCAQAVSDDPDEYPEGYAYDLGSRTLTVGDGRFGPVEPEVWGFEVSGLRVVESWLGYRIANRKGRKSSPLDDIRPERWTAEFTTELLRLLWILEATLAEFPRAARLLGAIVSRPLVLAKELPSPTPESREAPSEEDQAQLTLLP